MSIHNQTFRDFEVILVDNNSTDDTMKIVNEFINDMEIKVFKCLQKGIVPTLNTGIKHATGEYIARQDGDDFWYEDKLEKQVNFLESNPEIGIVGTQIQLLDSEGQIQKQGTMGIEIKYPLVDNEIRYMMIHGENPLCHPSVLIRAKLFELVGGYEKVFPKAEDLHLWLKFFPHTKFANLPEVLVDYTQTFSPDYDARVPLLLSDMYFSLYKTAGLIEGEKEKRVWDWQRDPNFHGNIGGR
tara:strand:+ start:2814 stop:3536 length:723 start_codon:yes stop_codon:yes gene_type:complete